MKLRTPLRRAVFWGAACLFAGHVSFCYGDTSSNGHCPKAISAKDLLSLRSIGGYTGNVSVSPDGQLVAFQLQDPDFSTHTYNLRWYAMRVDGHVPTYLGSGGDLMLQPAAFGRSSGSRAELVARWSPNSEWVAYLRKTGGEVQVWRSRADGSLQEQVTHNAADVMGFAWTADGAAIYYTVGRDRDSLQSADEREGNSGYLVDDRFMPPYQTKPLRFTCGESVWGVQPPESERCRPLTWLSRFDGVDRRATAEEERTFERQLAPQMPLDSSEVSKVRGVAWNAARDRVAWLKNRDADRNPGESAPLTLFIDGTQCAAPECTGQLKQIWWVGNELVFLRSEGHAYSIPTLYALKFTRRGPQVFYRREGTLNSCGVAGRTLICLEETPTHPRSIVRIGLDGSKGTLFDPNPDFPCFEIGTVERIEWEDGFGNDTFAHLVYPPGYQRKSRYPLVIVQYRSRGFLNGGVGDEYPIYPLAADGFLVLSFDRPDDWNLSAHHSENTLAGVAASEAEEWKDGYKERRKLSALEIILDRLDRRGIVDLKRIGITGLSDGADTVDYALFSSNLFAAAAMSGDWSPEYYSLTTNDAMRGLIRGFLHVGSGDQVVEKWAPLSIAHRAGSVTAPLLIQVPDTELVQTAPIYVALKDAGKPVEAYVFPDENHIKWQPQHKLAVAERAIDWFRFWLQDREDKNPTKLDQYQRWRQLRALAKAPPAHAAARNAGARGGEATQEYRVPPGPIVNSRGDSE